MKMNTKIIMLAIASLVSTQSVFSMDEKSLVAEAKALLAEHEGVTQQSMDQSNEGSFSGLPKVAEMSKSFLRPCKACIDRGSAVVSYYQKNPIFACGITALCCACCGYCGAGYASSAKITLSAAHCCSSCSTCAYAVSGCTGLCTLKTLMDRIKAYLTKDQTDGERLIAVLRKALDKRD